VEVLRLLRSGICEMDVRAGWARMAKRSGRGCEWSSLFLAAAWARTRTRSCSLISCCRNQAVCILYRPVSIIVPPCGILARDMGLRRLRGIYFESTSRARRNCGDESRAPKSLPACLGLGDPEIQ
jgi:hypothetical protein